MALRTTGLVGQGEDAHPTLRASATFRPGQHAMVGEVRAGAGVLEAWVMSLSSRNAGDAGSCATQTRRAASQAYEPKTATYLVASPRHPRTDARQRTAFKMGPDDRATAGEPPHSVKAERWLLGGLLVDDRTWPDAAARLTPDDFHHPPHGQIFRVLSEMVQAGQPVDVVTLAEELSRRALLEAVGGQDYLAELAERIVRKPGVPKVAAYARIVQEHATSRGLVDAGTAIREVGLRPQEKAVGPLLDEAERKIAALRRRKRPPDRPRHVADAALGVKERLERQAREERGQPTGVRTGLRELDAAIGGFHPGELVVIGGRPSMGKSTLLTNIAEHATRADTRDPRPVLFFALDESTDAVVARLFASLGPIDLNLLRRGLPWPEWERLGVAMGKLAKRPLYLEDGPHTASDLRLRARQLAHESGGLKMIAVDSLHGIRAEDGCRSSAAEPGDASWALKALAKEMQCPVVATSMVTRGPERRAGRRPELSDLRGSAAIEHDADVILLVFREEMYHRSQPDDRGLAEVIVAKRPTGIRTTLLLRFVGRLARFVGLEGET